MAVVVIVLVVFAVEQTGGGGGGPLDAIATAAEATQREPGGDAFIRATITASGSPEGITEAGPMVFENDGRVRGTMTVMGHTTGKRVKVQVIGDGTTSYASSDQLTSLPAGRKWVKVDFSPGDSKSPLPAATGPKEGLKVLEEMDGAEEVGKEDIRGVAATHYKGTLPVSANEVLGVEVQLSPPQVEVWIDGRGRVRRVSIVVSDSVGGGEEVTTDITMDFLRFGRVPKIELPKQDEIYDATSRLESELKSSAESG